jgi:hypothetical protein
MADVPLNWDLSTTSSDDENMSSEEDYTDVEENMIDLTGGPLETHMDLGEVLALVHPPNIEYDDDEARDMFDDGISESESSDSDVSDNYEELTEPEVITHIEYIAKDESDTSSSKKDERHHDSDVTYDSDSDDVSEESAVKDEAVEEGVATLL